MKFAQHKQQGGLYEVRELPDDRIEVRPQGGGLARPMTRSVFEDEYQGISPDFSYKEGLVTGIFLPNHVFLNCYTDGRRWNGFGMPSFTKEDGLLLVEYLPELWYNEERDVFVEEIKEAEYGPSTVLVDGKPIKVYAIGACSWGWDPVMLPGEKP